MKKLTRIICVCIILIPLVLLTLCLLLFLPVYWAFNKYTFVSVWKDFIKDNPVTNAIKSI